MIIKSTIIQNIVFTNSAVIRNCSPVYKINETKYKMCLSGRLPIQDLCKSELHIYDIVAKYANFCPNPTLIYVFQYSSNPTPNYVFLKLKINVW